MALTNTTIRRGPSARTANEFRLYLDSRGNAPGYCIRGRWPRNIRYLRVTRKLESLRLKSGQHLRHTHPRSDGLRRVDEQQAWDLGCLVFGTCPSPPTRFGGTRITGFACVHMFAACRKTTAPGYHGAALARQVWLSLPHEGFLAWLGGGGSRRHLTYW